MLRRGGGRSGGRPFRPELTFDLRGSCRHRDDGQDRLPRAQARVRLSELGDLRRPRFGLRLRALRRPPEGATCGPAGSSRWCRSARTSSRSTRRSSSTPGSGRPPGTSTGFTDPLVDCRTCKQRYRADQLDRARSRGKRPSKKPGEISDCDLTEARHFNLMFKTRRRRRRGDGLERVPPPGDGAGDLHQLQERRAARPPKAAVRDRTGRQVVSQRDHARQLHLPHARVRADGDGVLRAARLSADEWYRYWVDERYAWYLRYGASREPPARPPARRRRAVALLERDERSSSTSIPIGWSELEGVANRGDFDLTQHSRALRDEARVGRRRDRRALRPARDRARGRARTDPCSRS